MNDKIRSHIDALFDSAPATTRVKEAKEEMLAGCLDKYEDLIAQGRSPEDAYIAVISGIGDVDELLRALGQIEVEDPKGDNYNKRALYIAAGIFIFIVSIAVGVAIDTYVNGDLAGIVFLLICAAAVFVLVYGIIKTKSSVSDPHISLSGQIQEQLLSGGKDNKLLGAFSSAMWSLIVLVYLCIGFFFHLWHPGWLIFMFGAVLQTFMATALGRGGLRRGKFNAFMWTLSPFVYLVVSFLTNRWEITWIIFPLTLCVQQMMRLSRIWRDRDES